MLFSTILSGLGLMGLATAFPQRLATRQQASGQNVVYWGQNGGGTIENNDLAAYCTETSGIDVLVLAFLYQFGGAGGNVANGIIGQSCYISPQGQPQNCEGLTAAIATCKSRGVKIVLSLGGASGAYSLSSQSQAEAIGQYLWDAYGGSNSSVTRPLGANVMDGFDFDIETNGGSSQYYQYMIAKLRSLYATDPSRTYLITGAPQCPIPEPNMSVIIENSVFDWLMVQFYNNNDYKVPCALGINGDAAFNYNNWTSYLQTTPSKNAKLFIGVPASTLGANGTPAGAQYYATPDQLATIVNEYKTKPNFGGVMMWAAGFSDSNVSNGCNYAQQVKSILLTGKPCAGAPISTQLPTPTSTPAPTSPGSTPTKTTGSTAPTGGSGTGTVPQWGQCGGMGYTGPTQCVPPYTCVSSGAWWADCR